MKRNETEGKEKNLAEKYTDNMPLKLLIQNIPCIGTSLDTILSDAGNKLREKRLKTLLNSSIRAWRNLANKAGTT
jgi:hypothetical protein